MSWSTELFCNIHFNRDTFNFKYQVENKIDQVTEEIRTCEDDLKTLGFMTEPNKFFDKGDGDIANQLSVRIEENLELLQEYYVQKYKLELLLENWDNCHNDKGLAIDPPEGVEWDTAYLYGDFVKSIKHPDDNHIF